MEGQIAFSCILAKLRNLTLESEALTWPNAATFRSLEALPVVFEPA